MPNTLIELAPHEAYRIQPLRVKAVRIVGGSVWATRGGDPVDYVLESGDSLPVSSNDDPVISTFAKAAIIALEPRPLAPIATVQRLADRILLRIWLVFLAFRRISRRAA